MKVALDILYYCSRIWKLLLPHATYTRLQTNATGILRQRNNSLLLCTAESTVRKHARGQLTHVTHIYTNTGVERRILGVSRLIIGLSVLSWCADLCLQHEYRFAMVESARGDSFKVRPAYDGESGGQVDSGKCRLQHD